MNIKSEEDNKNRTSFILDVNTPAPFTVGLALNLQTTADRYKKNRFPVSLAGWIRPHMLVTYHNQYDTGILAIPAGTEMIVRYIYEGQIYGFVTKLFHKQTEPMPLWFLEYPLEIEVINLRQSARIPITIEIKTPEGEIFFTKDISRQGASLRLSSFSKQIKRNVGDILNLSFRLPDDTQVESIKATIVRQYIEQNFQLLGVKFDETIVHEMEILNRCLEKLEKDFFINQPQSLLWE